jgi:hypothetical protein
MAMTELKREHRLELLDGTSWNRDELRANLRDIRRVNRLGGGTTAILRELPVLLNDISPERSLRILDLATGSADIPLAIAQWAAKRKRRVCLIASDWSADIIAVAKDRVGNHAAIEFATYDARAVPLPDRSVDITLCSLALHHFAPDEAVRVLTEMKRLSRVGCVVNDLVRSRAGHAVAVVTSRLLTRNRLTRHDAPLSVLRAYTPTELDALLFEAGWEGAQVRRHPLFRMTAVWSRPA